MKDAFFVLRDSVKRSNLEEIEGSWDEPRIAHPTRANLQSVLPIRSDSLANISFV